jgi:hypothetical protein
MKKDFMFVKLERKREIVFWRNALIVLLGLPRRKEFVEKPVFVYPIIGLEINFMFLLGIKSVPMGFCKPNGWMKILLAPIFKKNNFGSYLAFFGRFSTFLYSISTFISEEVLFFGVIVTKYKFPSMVLLISLFLSVHTLFSSTKT